MPYSGALDPSLPAYVKKKPYKKRKQWIAIWQSVWKRTHSEQRAFAAANAAIALAEVRADSLRRMLVEALQSAYDKAIIARKLTVLIPVEKALAADIMRIWSQYQSAFLAQWNDHPDLDRACDVAAMATNLRMGEAIKAGILPAIRAGMTDAISKIVPILEREIPTPVPPAPWTAADLEGHVASYWGTHPTAELVTGISNETRDRMRNLLKLSISRGDTFEETTAALRNSFPEIMSQSRAETIAFTETNQAYERAGYSLMESRENMEKRWVPDGEGCPEICAPNAFADWIPFYDAFPSGDIYPLAHPWCRCGCEYREKAVPKSLIPEGPWQNYPSHVVETAEEQAMAKAATKGITSAEKMRLRSYSGQGYIAYNDYLRKGINPETYMRGLTPELVQGHVNTIARVISRTTYAGKGEDAPALLLYRGIKAKRAIELPPVGESFIDPGLGSATFKRSTADLFSYGKGGEQGAVVSIITPPGSTILPMDGLSKYAGEHEVLFPPGTRYVVRSKAEHHATLVAITPNMAE